MNGQKPKQSSIQIFCLLVLTLILSACSDKSDTPKPAAQPPKVPGEVYLEPDSPKKAYIKTTRLSLGQYPLLEPLAGKITYNESATSRVSSPVAGRVVTSPVALGSFVKPGAILLELDSPEVADAEADYDKAQADLSLASHAYNREKELYAGKAVSRKDLEQAQDDFNDASSEVRRAQEHLKNLRINPTQTIQQSGRFDLRATIPGVVVERKVNPGMEVRPDLDSPLFIVSDINKLTLLMEVFEINLSKIKLGQKLSVSVPAYPGKTFPAIVKYIGQVLDENTRTVQVRCDLPNPNGALLPGMYATITVESDPADQAIMIPLTAVFTEDEADYVFVAIDDNHYRQQAVKIELRLKDKAIIKQGLKADELLVSEGALMLRAEEEVDTDSANP